MNIFQLFKRHVSQDQAKLEHEIKTNLEFAMRAREDSLCPQHAYYGALWNALQAKRKLDALPTTEDVVSLLQHAGWTVDDIRAMTDGE